MSASIVRSAFRSSWASKMPTVPLRETINAAPASTISQSLWATVDFTATVQPATVGGKQDETGSIIVGFAAPSGAGDAAALAAAASLVSAYAGWVSTDSAGQTVIESIGAPENNVEQTRGEFFLMTIPLNYRRINY